MGSKMVNLRKHIRFVPDSGTIAEIDVSSSDVESFSPTISGLVFEESFKGCGLTLLRTAATQGFKVDMQFLIRVGKIGPLYAEVRWRKDLDEKVMNIGVYFLD